ncbi:MAG: HD domain-containing protein [Coriobacteriia bacterium]|nr:HD domain-containing protein [Coriobacteriia bacterium]
MESYLSQRQALISSAQPGVAAARELAALTDEAVRELARAASSATGGGRFALAALGGWGSGAMLPTSDLDILVLSDADERKLKPLVEAVLYPLWDAGLHVGHQVRTPRGQLRAMREDLASCTAALTGRPLAGDEEWVAHVLADGAAEARKRSRTLLRELEARPRPGSPYLLEPELKEDAGGRRDYDELVWTAAVVSGSVAHDPSALLAAGLATAEELATVGHAAEVVSAARFELGRAGLGARMTLDATEALATVSAGEVQLALAQTALVLSRVRRRAVGDVVEADTPLSPEALFALFDAGQNALDALEEAAQAGRLDALLPGFRDLMTLRRPGIGHEFTVGAHSLRTTLLIADMPVDGALARSREAIEHPRVLQVAGLAHDIGKTEPGLGHADRGALPAEEAARRFGLSDAAAQDVGDLVHLHLALAETATRIDLDDEDAILLAAARIARRELLAPLHLLTAADSLATGPATWSRWTASLVGALVSRLDAALSDDVDGAGIAQRGEAVRAEALASMMGSPRAECAFVEGAPLRYLASRTTAEIVRDARLVAGLQMGGAEQAQIAVGSGPTPDTHSVTVVAIDAPELLARIAGAFALAGLDILALDAYGSRDGVVLDSFVVTSATRRAVTTESFTQLERFLRAALRDRLELQTRLAERRKHYPARQSGPVRVETISAGWDTAVRVSAPDRPGLLHDLARAVSATGLDIRWAKVLTVDGIALDTFHVVGADGSVVDDPGVLGHLAMRLREIH